jgi:hypothetical protein
VGSTGVGVERQASAASNRMAAPISMAYLLYIVLLSLFTAEPFGEVRQKQEGKRNRGLLALRLASWEIL